MSHNGVDRPQVAKIAAQIGSSLMPDTDQWVNRFTVNSTSSSSVYTVSQRRSDGVWGCGCPGWRHHRKCKHVTDILRRLAALPAAAQQFEPAVLAMLASARTAYLDLGAPQPIRNPTVLPRRELDLGGAL
jgi:hypothetical protein